MGSKYICVTTVRKRYGLRDHEIDRLPCKYCRNPHYRSAAPMRLYIEEQVIELARVVEVERKEEAKRKQEELEKRREARENERRDQALEAMTRVKSFKPMDILLMKPGKLGLPREVVNRIFDFVIEPFLPRNTFQAFDLLGSVKAVHRLALTSTDFLVGLSYAHEMISKQLDDIPAHFDWDKLLTDPVSFQVIELKTALKKLNLKISGNKPGMSILYLFSLIS